MHPLYRRFRAVACRSWGMSPAEFDRQARARDILLCDVMDLIRVLMTDPFAGAGILAYVAPSAVRRTARRRADNVRAQHNNASLMTLLSFATPKGPKEAEFMERLKEELSGGPPSRLTADTSGPPPARACSR